MIVQNYAAAPSAVRNFSVQPPPMFNWGFHVVDRWGREQRSRTALILDRDEGRTVTYTFGDVSIKSSQLANYLSKSGVRKGDPVLIMLPNTPMLWLSVVALIKLGAIAVPSAPTLTTKDIAYRITAAGIRAVVSDDSNAKKFWGVTGSAIGERRFLAEGNEDGWLDLNRGFSESTQVARSETRADDTALVYFTSGTEGLPKMVVHTHVSYPLGHRATALWLGIEEGKLHWNISSPGWAKHAWSSIFAPWNAGAPTLSYDYKGGFNAAKHLRKIEEHGVESLCAAPTIWRMFALEDLLKYDLSSLRNVCSAGEPLNPEIIERFRKATGLTVRDGYGQTETVLAIANFPGLRIKEGSVGVPSPLYDVDIVDEEGNVLPPDEEGYVAIRTSPRPFALFKEYAKDPGKTSDVFRNGWYYTGDRATKDADGYFWFVGRADDVIKSSGYRIGPFEVESALIKHPSVAEAAVVPAPDPVRGAVVKAFIILREGHVPSQALADELAAFVARETGPYKHPRKIEFVTSLEPVKTISGKIRRKNLRLAEYGRAQRSVRGAEYDVTPLRGG
ncbi:MAG TPA: acyl--CoA ligase [Nitrososphaerales archaeon]|nr:acyl--CoA ligase [Nitrososphaerales archaeon]